MEFPFRFRWLKHLVIADSIHRAWAHSEYIQCACAYLSQMTHCLHLFSCLVAQLPVQWTHMSLCKVPVCFCAFLKLVQAACFRWYGTQRRKNRSNINVHVFKPLILEKVFFVVGLIHVHLFSLSTHHLMYFCTTLALQNPTKQLQTLGWFHKCIFSADISDFPFYFSWLALASLTPLTGLWCHCGE